MAKILFKNANIITYENGSFKYLKNAYLVVSDSIISYIGQDCPNESFDTTYDMYDKMLLPGLINCHNHSSMTLLRGVGSFLPLDKWLEKIFAIEDNLREEDVVRGTNLAILEMLATGTTSFSDMYFFPFAIAENCIESSGIKANLTRVFMGQGNGCPYEDFPQRKTAIQLLEKYNDSFDDRLKIDWSVHAQYTIDMSYAPLWAQEINERGGRLHIHLSETEKEHRDSLERFNMTPAQWFDSLNFFNIPTQAAHCVWVSDDDMKILKERNVSVVHNPSSNLKLGSGIAPIKKMLDMGINITLGTDGAASNNNMNLFEEMHIASLIHNGYLNNPTAIKPEDVLKMATINGAKAQGRFDTGSLEVGKKADIIAINLDQPHLVPNIDPLALLIYSAQGSDVCMTMVDGKILYKDGEYLTMDKEKILKEAEMSKDFLLRR